MPLNVEFKARCSDPDRIRGILNRMEARSAGIDHQTDTYFTVPSGRLKLRDGNIERSLIYYRRDDSPAAKRSDVWLAPCPEPNPLRELLSAALGVHCVVKKRREIFFHGRTKIHVDDVPGLGNFLEVEVVAGNDDDRAGMHAECNQWMERFGVHAEDLIDTSYSDMISSS